MITKFWDKLAEGMAGKWTAQNLGSSLVFWVAGLMAWSWHKGWERVTPLLTIEKVTLEFITLAFGGLIVLAVSATLADWLTLPIIRVTEGYWRGPFRRLRFALARRKARHIETNNSRWEELANISQRTTLEDDEYARLDAQLSRYPADTGDGKDSKNSGDIMPTMLGNLLRGAECYPAERYGMEITVCWPRLWLLLPKEVQEELSVARNNLNEAAQMMLWGALLIIWSVWAWPAVLAAAAMSFVAYNRACVSAGIYGDLLRAAFDLNRFRLYEALRLPLPSNPVEEMECGQKLTVYLLRGAGLETVRYSADRQARSEVTTM